MRLLFWINTFQTHTNIDILSISCETAMLWMAQDLTGDKSTCVQVMAIT